MKQTIRKYIKDGKVAVLYSPGFGAGWSTWSDAPQCVFDPELAEWIDGGGDADTFPEYVNADSTRFFANRYGVDSFYEGGLESLEVEWVYEGTRFKIDEYDGSESVTLVDSDPDVYTA